MALFDGELIDGQHNPGTRAAVMRVEPIADSGSACIRNVIHYFDSVEHAQAAADALALDAQAGPFPDTRFVVCDPRRTAFP